MTDIAEQLAERTRLKPLDQSAAYAVRHGRAAQSIEHCARTSGHRRFLRLGH